MADVQLSTRAFCKLILHAAKYPHCSVNGVLLSEKVKGSDSKVLVIADCIPLFHICRYLTPMLDVALAQIDHYCKSTGLFISGYYQANENVRDTSPDFVALKIADKVAEHYGDACLVMVDNRRVCLAMGQMPLNVMQHVDGKWVSRDKGSTHLEDDSQALATASVLLQKKAYRNLIDFDNHLDDITQEWLNTSLNQVVEEEL